MSWLCLRGARGRFGGFQTVPGVVSSPFLLPAPRVLRCVWRAVLSGCPLPSLAGTPFHVVCAFRGLGPISLLVFPACLLCVCALALSSRPLPPPSPLVRVARAPRVVPVLGAGRAVPRGPCPSACPALVPCSVWFFLGGGAVPFPPYLARGCVLPVGWVCASGAFGRRGVGGGCRRRVRRSPRPCGREGQWVGGLPCLCPSLCLPSAGNKVGVLGVALAMGGLAPIQLGFVLACCPRPRSVWRPGVVAWVHLSIVVPAGAGGWGTGAGPAPASLLGAAVLPGGGGIIPSASGGVGAGAPVACERWVGWGDRWGVTPWLPTSLGGAACSPLSSPPFVAGASPPGVRFQSGSWGSLGCRVRPAAGRGGGGGGP